MRQIRSNSRIATVTASMHPAAALRGMGQFRRPIYTALNRGARWAERADLPKREFKMVLDPSPDEVAEYLARVPSNTVIAEDIEAHKERWWDVSLVGVSAYDGEAIVFDPMPNLAALREFNARKDLLKAGHNLAYDTRGLRKIGAPLAWPIVDTIQAAARIWPPFREAKERRWLALSSCVLRCFDGWAYWKEADLPSIRAWYRALGFAEHEIDRAYCGFDVVWTRRLWLAEVDLLKRTLQWDVFQNISAPAAPVLHEMEWDGMLVDRPLLERLQAETLAETARLEAEVEIKAAEAHAARRAAVGAAVAGLEVDILTLQTAPNEMPCPDHPKYNGLRKDTKKTLCAACGALWTAGAFIREKIAALRKARQKGKAVYDRIGDTFPHNDNAWRALLFEPHPIGLGLEPLEVTATGLAKVDKDNIEALWRRNPDIPILKSRVELQHGYQRYHLTEDGEAKGSLAIVLDENNITHPTLSMHRTENTRIAAGKDDSEDDKVRLSDTGNIQNKPDRDRRVYIAPPGMLLVDRDWSQIEARAEAWMAEEVSMLRAWKAGRDIHSINGAALAHALAGTLPPGDARIETYLAVTEQTADDVLFRFGGVEVSFRYGAKRATHGWDYGMLSRKTAKLYGIPIRVAQALIDAYFAQWPRLLDFQRRIVRTVMETHELRNVFGGRLEFFGFEWDRTRKEWKLKDREEALAYPAASAVAEMVKACLPAMREAAHECGGRLCTTTHDQYLAAVPESRVADYVALTTPIMEKPWPEFGRLPEFGEFVCPSDVAIGRNWGKWHATDNPDGVRKVKR